MKKGQILQEEGELDTKAYIVQVGLLRSYAIDEKGKEHIFMFAPEGWIIGDGAPPDEPGQLFKDALEDSEVVVLKKRLEQPNVGKLLKRLFVLQKRIIMLMSKPAILRYEHFIETYPGIPQRIPQKMIASYLGITPEALSKVKAQRQSQSKGLNS